MTKILSPRRISRTGKHLPAVYLSGPITGIALEEASRWRTEVAVKLQGVAEVIDPTRDDADAVMRYSSVLTQPLGESRLLHGKGTLARCRFDIERSDLVLANVLGATVPSIGTIGEIFLANALNKPVMIVREPGNPHNHDMLNGIAGWIVNSLDEAVAKIAAVVRVGAGR